MKESAKHAQVRSKKGKLHFSAAKDLNNTKKKSFSLPLGGKFVRYNAVYAGCVKQDLAHRF